MKLRPTKRSLTQRYPSWFIWVVLLFLFNNCSAPETGVININKGDHIVLIGGNLCSRMMNYNHFETALYLQYPNDSLVIRNMCDGGNTPGFRPHSARNEPWAFDGAEAFQDEFAQASGSIGHRESPDEWLTKLEADKILAFFGYSESFEGEEGLEAFKGELEAFIKHTKAQQYNGESAPELVLLSPIAFQDLSADQDLPNGEKENANLERYTNAMAEIAAANEVAFIDLFHPSQAMFAKQQLETIDGFQLTNEAYKSFGQMLVNKIFGKSKVDNSKEASVFEAVAEKNWYWHMDIKIPNGVHVYGRRYDPFGPDNYPDEFKKLREMIDIRDKAIWASLQGQAYDVAAADAQTHSLRPVESNYKPGDYGRGGEYLYGQEAVDKIQVAEGFKMELFASEKEFPDLANPVQLSFDNKGRLWVAVMPTYPHWKPGDPMPDDKLIILEDTDGDNKADKQTIFADKLHIPVGFEFAPEGVYVSQGTNLILLTDTDGDDKADKKEIILSGFDDHDTHHVISAFCADPSGAIYMGEGVFLHTNVETSYGTVRGTNGGFYRYNTVRKRLERTAQLSIPNPWGIAFDEWGQNFFAETSGPDVRWMQPGTVKSRYGVATHKSYNLIEDKHRVRPTSGLEFVHSRHFPDEMQGDMLIANAIGFLGMKQHQMIEKGTGYESRHRQDLFVSEDLNFRPVDMEFAPDGSLYVVDWHNVLIGHMQHNARDPYRDHVHGRIYRITYPSRPLVEPAKVDGATITELLDNLKLPEYRTRYRSRRELRARNKAAVLTALKDWTAALDKNEERYDHHVLEALWVSWGLNDVDKDLLDQCRKSKDHRVRAAAARILRFVGHQVPEQVEWLKEAALDNHGRVRLEAIVAASWLPKEDGLAILSEAGNLPLDDWMVHAFRTAEAHLNDRRLPPRKPEPAPEHLKGADLAQYESGKKIFARDGFCSTCHQSDGKGLQSVGYPPLAASKWVLENEERLIKLTLKGLYGPIEVLGEKYDSKVPMTPYEGLMSDQEMADVLTYVRNAFGNKATPIKAAQVAKVRAAIKGKEGFYAPADLLKEHPHQEIQ